MIKPESNYTWLTFKGQGRFVKGARFDLALIKGTNWGFRWSADGKKIRMILKGYKTKVITISPRILGELIENSKPVK